MILRVLLLAALATWGMTWSKDANAVINAPQTCGTVLVGWNGNEAIFQVLCGYSFWESGGGGGYYDPDGDPGYGGAGSSGWATPVAHYAVPHFPANPHPATCESGLQGRYDHAAADAGAYSAERSLTGQSMLRKDDILTITYDDGGTEKWHVLSVMTFGIIKDIPIPGTLECP